MKISKNIIIYGIGQRGRALIALMELCNMPIGHIIDSDRELWGKTYGEYIIESPDILKRISGRQICITVVSLLAIADIRTMLQYSYQCNQDNEVSYYRLIMYLYEKIDMKGWIKKERINFLAHTTIIFDCEAGLVLGGIEEWTKGICSKFLDEGEFDAYILTDSGKYSVPDELNSNILQAYIDKGKMFSLRNIKQILKCIIEHMPCILVTSQPDQTLLAGKILRDIFGDNVKVISGIRGGCTEINKRYMDMRSCTDIYVCVNSAIKKDMIARGVQPGKIYTMLCPIECPAVLKRSYSLRMDNPVRIGFAGRLEKEEKRMDLMLKVIELLEKMRVYYYFEFAGEGSYEEKIKEFIKDNNCEEKIKLLGRIDKKAIPGFWKDKDICINTSDHEGRSRSTIEAMANGAVPVVTNTWGVRDDIEDGKNGFIVDIGDYNAIAERISLLDGNRNRLFEMGQKAHEELRKKSSMDDHYMFWRKMIDLVMPGNTACGDMQARGMSE